MTAKVLANIIQEVYYSGVVKSGAQKLKYEDFLQLVYIAKGEALYKIYLEQEISGLMPVLNSMLTPYVLDVKIDKYKRKIASIPWNVNVVQLPSYAGIYSVYPVSDNTITECDPIIRTEPGAEWLYCKEDIGIPFFVPYNTEIVFYHLPSCIKKVQVMIVDNGEESNIPIDIAFTIAKNIWQQVFRTIALPIDKRDDGNPNVDEIFRTKLTSPELNG